MKKHGETKTASDAIEPASTLTFKKAPVYTVQDIILKILSVERFEGGFQMDTPLAVMLGLSAVDLMKLSKKIMGRQKMNRFLVLSTAIVLEILEKRYLNEKTEWSAVVDKSKKWLDREISEKSPMIEHTALLKWTERYVGGTRGQP
ncbi:MAG TPA: hypothetical protein VGJ94_18980 [Syntrophorhabdaceae bacterium]|jgi:hypothetical protein